VVVIPIDTYIAQLTVPCEFSDMEVTDLAEPMVLYHTDWFLSSQTWVRKCKIQVPVQNIEAEDPAYVLVVAKDKHLSYHHQNHKHRKSISPSKDAC
jgi:hypothetical protein